MRIIFLSFFIICSFNSLAFANSMAENIPQFKKSSLSESAFLRFLGPTILKIMEEKGDLQLFTEEKIESILYHPQEDSYDVTLHVVGFEGPLNPPYNNIRMTIRIPGERSRVYDVISYQNHLPE
ncbi:DUF3888 domain-containing protein [Niallia sp. Man26]|uniref:DUF3888 domain-containing protein n=1 Tax=Niallia sp. Man26 TaxID=2912824 RepID=UPI001EDC4A00|nr:DUF3888 domain-containing protein [Niallia sp. Man26]UPO90106.1 DUF3888 domain-containing protein [Niallia sp. Man26]